MRPSGPSGPSRCSWPRISPSALGRSRSASGVGASEAKSSAIATIWGVRRLAETGLVGTGLSELNGRDHALAADAEAGHARCDPGLELLDAFHVLAVDRDHHVARPHEPAGIGTGPHLGNGDAGPPFGEAHLLRDGRRQI